MAQKWPWCAGVEQGWPSSSVVVVMMSVLCLEREMVVVVNDQTMQRETKTEDSEQRKWDEMDLAMEENEDALTVR
jgi:hypothetical protein